MLIRVAVAALALSAAALPAAETQTIPLAGTWAFRLDPQNTGRGARWQDATFPSDPIYLPGSTDEAGYGAKTRGPEKGWLSRPYTYEGPAWYQKEVVIPESWRGKRITLFLERPHWQTELWVDGVGVGAQDSLSTPHVYDLTALLRPGPHRITLCVDNTYKIDVGRNAHSITEHTQTNWNGIVGRIELQATPPVWIDTVQVYPDLNARKVRVEATVRSIGAALFDGELSARLADGSAVLVPLNAGGLEQRLTLSLDMGPNARPWDEYEGAVQPLELSVKSGTHTHSFATTVGARAMGVRGKQFTLNGRPIFLRGTLECNIFPKTGYPPTTEDEWERLFRIARSYGLNHFRFHSWCPPEAAFAAADRAGFLLHVELPVWSNTVGRNQGLNDYMRAEALRILKTYGNHPSFTMLCLGNELTGDYAFMDKLVADLKAGDNRRLFTFTADHRRNESGPTSDYYVTHHTRQGPVRIHGARFTKTMDGTDYDHSKHVAITPMPLVAHELGQWVTFPDYGEIASYTGVLKPRNLEAFRERLAARGMLDQAADFQLASGRFAWRLYKEDIEACLRTRDFGGVQLLQLQDFPGQGEALIGLLDSFWNSKRILEPHEMRMFFSETVPLLRIPKFVWTSDETFRAKAELAHYGKAPLAAGQVAWSIRDGRGKALAEGSLPLASLAPGTVAALGQIEAPLSGLAHPTRIEISVWVPGAQARNRWEAWVYPAGPAPAQPDGVLVTHTFDTAARKRLEEGGKVMLLWPPKQPGANLIGNRFLPVFWSLSWFPKQPGTLGIFCDPAHPALMTFPTDTSSNWQWWDVAEQSQAFVLNETDPAFRPIVQVIDDYHRNHKLGAVWEARVGKGKLLAASFDLESNLESRPAARQLLQSLFTYVSGDRFEPRHELTMGAVARILAAN